MSKDKKVVTIDELFLEVETSTKQGYVKALSLVGFRPNKKGDGLIQGRKAAELSQVRSAIKARLVTEGTWPILGKKALGERQARKTPAGRRFNRFCAWLADNYGTAKAKKRASKSPAEKCIALIEGMLKAGDQDGLGQVAAFLIQNKVTVK